MFKFKWPVSGLSQDELETGIDFELTTTDAYFCPTSGRKVQEKGQSQSAFEQKTWTMSDGKYSSETIHQSPGSGRSVMKSQKDSSTESWDNLVEEDGATKTYKGSKNVQLNGDWHQQGVDTVVSSCGRSQTNWHESFRQSDDYWERSSLQTSSHEETESFKNN